MNKGVIAARTTTAAATAAQKEEEHKVPEVDVTFARVFCELHRVSPCTAWVNGALRETPRVRSKVTSLRTEAANNPHLAFLVMIERDVIPLELAQ